MSRTKGEITHLRNPDAMHRVLNQLGPEYRNTSRPFQNKDISKLFISRDQATIILLRLAETVSLPKDITGPEIMLDKDNGYWTAIWKRTYGGYLFEDDNVSISINAVSGEFSSYSKTYKARPCPTIVKVQKREAVGVAFKDFVDYFSSDWWQKNKDNFELVSADLKIVRPDEYWRNLTPFYEAESRLAWVVVFDVKKGRENFVLSKDPSIIKVDAATKKVLSSEINIP